MNRLVNLVNLCLALVAVCFVARPGYAFVLNVPDEFQTIQSAIDSSMAGDTVSISPGDYPESLTLSDHALTIAGPWFFSGDTTDISSVRIHGSSDQRVFMISAPLADPVVIAGLRISDGNALVSGGGAQIDFASVHFDHVQFVNNQATRGGAIFSAGSNLEFQDCSFDSNQATDGAGGALLANGGNVILERTQFRNNSATNGAGAFSGGAPPGIIRDCLFQQNQSGGSYGSVTLDAAADERGCWTIRGNTFIENTGGWGAALSSWGIDSLLIQDNFFVENHASIEITPTSNGDGGALVSVLGNWIDIIGNRFWRNRADDWGGTMILATDGRIRRNEFVDNESLYFSVMYVTLMNNQSGSLLIEQDLFQDNHFYDGADPVLPFGCIGAMPEATITIQESDFINNQGWSVNHNTPGITTANNNFWGDPTGPYQEESNPGGRGDTIQVDIPFDPWSTVHFFRPRITRLEELMQFGSIPVDSTTSCFLRIENAGVQELQVNLVRPPASPFQWNGPSEFILQSGDSIRIPVQFTPDEVGRFLDTLRMETNDPTHQTVFVALEGDAELTAAVEDLETIDPPESFLLDEPWPNPFNNTCLVQMNVPSKMRVSVELYDILGRLRAVLSDTRMEKGIHRLQFDGSSLASGAYFLIARNENGITLSRRVTLLH